MFNINFNKERVCRKLLTPIFKLIFNPTYIDIDKIPKQEPIIIISNHVSYLDGLVISAAFDRHIRFVVYREYFKKPFIKHFLKLNKAISIYPQQQEVEIALDKIGNALKQNQAICIFPEGKISLTGNLGRFKPGIEWILEQNQIKIYPIYIDGLWGSIFSKKYIKSKFRFLKKTKNRKITMICGDPIRPEHANIDYLQKKILKLQAKIRNTNGI